MLCYFLLYHYMHTYIPIYPPSCVSFPPSISNPSRWWQNTELISLCHAAASHQLSVLHLVVYICQCFSLTLSQLIFPLPVSSSPFSMSVSSFLSCLQVHQNHFFSFSLDSIYMSKHTVFVFLFLTYFTLYDRLQVHPPHYK